MTRVYYLRTALLDEYVASLAGKFLDESYYDLLLSGEDADVLKPDGEPLLMLRHGVLPAEVCRLAHPALRRAVRTTMNRGIASGGSRSALLKRNGPRTRTTYAPAVESGIIGFFDRTAREPFCRTTAFTRQDVEGWANVVPFIQSVNSVFRETSPERYAAQLAVVRRTPAEWVIPGTVFSTVTVNRNYQSAVHKDKGDLKEGFGTLSVLRAGEYDGGHLVFPQFRVAVDLFTRDVLLADVHQWHANTPLIGVEGAFERLSCVLYFRDGMQHCLPPAEELRHAKLRRPGDPLNPR